jgi:hypothetical protein
MATLMDLVVPQQKPKGTQMLRDLVRGYNREAVSGMLGAPVDMANTLVNLLIAGGGFAAHKAGLIDQPPELIDNARAVGSSDWIYNRLPNQPQMTGSKSEYAGRLAGALMSPPAMMKVAPQTLASLLRTAQQKAPGMLDDYVAAIGGKTNIIPKGNAMNADETLDPRRIVEIHSVQDKNKFERITKSMSAEGWKGDPLLVWEDGSGGVWALNGSHRIAAARKAGIDVPVKYVDPTAMENGLAAKNMSFDELIGSGDDRVADFFKEAGDKASAELLEREVSRNIKRE